MTFFDDTLFAFRCHGNLKLTRKRVYCAVCKWLFGLEVHSLQKILYIPHSWSLLPAFPQTRVHTGSRLSRTSCVNYYFNRWATFTRDGIYPYAIQETHFQDSFSVNVWVDMVGNHLIGLYIFPSRLTAVAYLDILNNILGNFLENVPLGTRRDVVSPWWGSYSLCPWSGCVV